MKAFFPTPESVIDLMVEKLFSASSPGPNSRILDPGCGTGAFVAGILRWCERRGTAIPRIDAIESDPALVAIARERFADIPQVSVIALDFLKYSAESYDYIIGNPPYVPITGMTSQERDEFRSRFNTAKGRFDLYMLFFEQSLRLLNDFGRLVFITPEKFLYVQTAQPLRRLLAQLAIEELDFLDEETFRGLVTYPLVSTIVNHRSESLTRIIARDGACISVQLDKSASSWLPAVFGARPSASSIVLDDIALRVSCGVATGADSIFVCPTSEIAADLRKFAYPTIAGRELAPLSDPVATMSMLIPYDKVGRLLPENELGALGRYLSLDSRRNRLLQRTCVARKPWYAFHETPQLDEILKPKIICKDIGSTPFFVVDREGSIVPRHSAYYVIPNDPAILEPLAEYLNSTQVQSWLKDHCHRAANGFIRLQSTVLKRIPIPVSLASRTSTQEDLFLSAALSA